MNNIDLIQRCISFLMLLQCIVVRLRPPDWDGLRDYIARDIPLRILGNIPNSIELFQELESRGKINLCDMEYLRNGFYDIGRVDLVHLLDCVQQGDYSLLRIDALANSRREDRGLQDRSLSLNRHMRDVSFDSFSNAADNSSTSAPSEATTQSSMRNDVIGDGQVRSTPNMHADEQTSATPEVLNGEQNRRITRGGMPSYPQLIICDIPKEL